MEKRSTDTKIGELQGGLTTPAGIALLVLIKISARTFSQHFGGQWSGLYFSFYFKYLLNGSSGLEEAASL
jgi:hypothetical protein